MVALFSSLIVGIAGVAVIVAVGKRRASDARLTWGEAMAAAAFAFFMFFWWYGVIPHQWLTLAEAGWDWSSAKTVWGPGEILRPEAEGGWLPLTINYLHLKDLVAVLIYGVGLAGLIAIWAWWNDRDKRADAAAAVVPTSSYGRPLVRKG